MDGPAAQPLESVTEGWTVREAFVPDRYRYNGEPCGAYQISIENDVNTSQEDPGNTYIHGRYLAQDLDHMSIYATGQPLRERNVDAFMSPIFPPAGWTSNGESVLAADDWALMTTGVSSVSQHRRLPTLPLRAILTTLQAYRATDEVTYRLASLHFEALTTELADGPYLLLAQTVEVMRNLGIETTIPDDVRKLLNRGSPQWLREIANTRRSTRHPARRGASPGLHPEMSLEEESDFVYDADLLTRYVVSNRLGVPFVAAAGIKHHLLAT